LEGDRQTVEGTDGLAGRQRLVGVVGEAEGLLVVELGDDGVDPRVDPRDLRDVGGHHLPRREVAPANPRRKRGRGHEAEFAVRHARTPCRPAPPAVRVSRARHPSRSAAATATGRWDQKAKMAMTTRKTTATTMTTDHMPSWVAR